MKKLPLIGAAVAALVSVVAFAVPSFAHNDNQSWNDWHNSKRQLTLKQTNIVPNTPPTTIGAMYVLTDDVFDKSDNKIGHDALSCTVTAMGATSFDALCVGTLSIDNRGDIQVQGLFTTGTDDFKVSITGGDGLFRFARGQLSVHTVSPTEHTVTFDFN
jgi:hypothetical protein